MWKQANNEQLAIELEYDTGTIQQRTRLST